jgi:hypothetical protein
MEKPMPSDESGIRQAKFRKLLWAMAAFAALGLMAFATLGDAVVPTPLGSLRLVYAVWVALGGFAMKTWIAYKAGW